MFHHGTIRKYTAALLNIFNEIEVQYASSNGDILSRNVPIRYSTREKSVIFDEYTTEQIMSGNYNVLPRASLSLVALMRSDERVMNKNMKIHKVSNENNFEFMYNSIPYEFTYELLIQCRGMNEATMLVEQIVVKFNPTYSIDIWDATNLKEPTRVPVRLLDVSIESGEYEELSDNIFNVTFSFSLSGNLYQPIKTIDKIKDFKILINKSDGEFFDRTAIMGWDINDSGNVINESIHEFTDKTNKPEIIDLLCPNVSIGSNNLILIYKDYDNKFNELTFEWDVIIGDAIINPDKDKAVLIINTPGTIEILVKVTDIHGNYSSYSKTFTV